MRRRAFLLALAAVAPARPALAERRLLLRGGGQELTLGPEEVVSAEARPGDFGDWRVDVSLTPAAGAALAELTAALVTQPLEILFDGSLVAAPVVREPILGGAFVISGLTQVQARRIAVFLRG